MGYLKPEIKTINQKTRKKTKFTDHQPETQNIKARSSGVPMGQALLFNQNQPTIMKRPCYYKPFSTREGSIF